MCENLRVTGLIVKLRSLSSWRHKPLWNFTRGQLLLRSLLKSANWSRIRVLGSVHPGHVSTVVILQQLTWFPQDFPLTLKTVAVRHVFRHSDSQTVRGKKKTLPVDVILVVRVAPQRMRPRMGLITGQIPKQYQTPEFPFNLIWSRASQSGDSLLCDQLAKFFLRIPWKIIINNKHGFKQF